VWSGLRPLVRTEGSGKTKDLSRRHRVSISKSGVISIIGGKLTTYRKMAEDTVDEALKTIGRSARCKTKRLRLRGAADAQGTASHHLFTRYGSDWTEVQHLIDADASLAQPLIPGMPYLRAEAIHAVRYEWARTVDDVLSRRTRALLLDRRAALAAAPEVARLLAGELGWDDSRVELEVQRFSEVCAKEERAAHMSEAEYLASR